MNRGNLEARNIVLNVGVFDSKQRFVDGLRASFGGGTFLLGNKVSGNDIGAYVSYLKNDYAEQERPRKFKEAEYIGFQEGSYWLLSSEIQIEGKRLLTPLEQRYLITNSDLNQYELVVNGDLLNYGYLKQAFLRFNTLSQCFGQNAPAFQLAAAFVLSRILRNATSPGDVWTESSLGMIYSETKCIGKSLSLYLLALAQGIPSRVHLMFLSGGNQNLCGTSAKKMQDSLTLTNAVVFIDDPDINKPFGEFLLQVQGRLLFGSKKEGMSASRAGVLLSSNSPEISRIVGRVVCFNYTGPREDMQAHDSWIMENSLIPHMQENKGLFLAWAVMYLDIWKRIYPEASGIVMSILSRVFEEARPQQRWLKGVTSVVLANTMIRLSIGRPAKTANVIAYLIYDTLSDDTNQASELTPL